MARSHPFLAVWDTTLALGMVLSLETQLQFGNTPVGPGEILLAAWMVLVVLLEVLRFQWTVSKAFWELMCFWAAFMFGESIGAAMTIAHTNFVDWSLVLHDLIAYLLLIALTGLLTIAPSSEPRLQRIQWLTIMFGAALLLLQLAQAFGLVTFKGIDPWYWNRYRGWSDNPNQLALEALVIGVMSLNCAEVSVRWPSRLVAVACLVVAIVAGWLTRSNAYGLVVIEAAVLIATIKAARFVARCERRGIPAFSFLAIPVSVLLLTACLLVPVVQRPSYVLGSLENASFREDKSETSGELKLRLYLWKDAVERGVESYLLGFGPGPHLKIPYSVLAGRRSSVEPPKLQHPKLGLAPNFESHDTILELFLQGGALSAAAFVCLCALALRRTWNTGKDALMTSLLALGTFGIFHVIFRHPIVWFVISLALVSGSDMRRTAARASRVSPLRARIGAPEMRGNHTLV